MAPKGYKNPEYTEDQKSDFLEYARVEGTGPAIRHFGYPTYPTAIKWAKERGVDVSQSTIMEAARKAHTFYVTEDLVLSIEEVMDRILNDIRTKSDLTADDYNKYSNALAKMVDKHLVLAGKAASITESRAGAQVDNAISELVSEMAARNAIEKDQHNI